MRKKCRIVPRRVINNVGPRPFDRERIMSLSPREITICLECGSVFEQLRNNTERRLTMSNYAIIDDLTIRLDSDKVETPVVETVVEDKVVISEEVVVEETVEEVKEETVVEEVEAEPVVEETITEEVAEEETVKEETEAVDEETSKEEAKPRNNGGYNNYNKQKQRNNK